jgi:general secretion pathway protein G
MEDEKGFTIVELIVVVATIAVLAAVVLTNVNQYASKARDAKRTADMAQLQKVLDMYYADNGSFPSRGWTCSNDSSWTSLQATLQQYIKALPVDPTNNAGYSYNGGVLTYCYYSSNYGKGSGCDWYMLVYRLENTTFYSPGIRTCPYTGFSDGNGFNYSGTITVGRRVPN